MFHAAMKGYMVLPFALILIVSPSTSLHFDHEHNSHFFNICKSPLGMGNGAISNIACSLHGSNHTNCSSTCEKIRYNSQRFDSFACIEENTIEPFYEVQFAMRTIVTGLIFYAPFLCGECTKNSFVIEYSINNFVFQTYGMAKDQLNESLLLSHQVPVWLNHTILAVALKLRFLKGENTVLLQFRFEIFGCPYWKYIKPLGMASGEILDKQLLYEGFCGGNCSHLGSARLKTSRSTGWLSYSENQLFQDPNHIKTWLRINLVEEHNIFYMRYRQFSQNKFASFFITHDGKPYTGQQDNQNKIKYALVIEAPHGSQSDEVFQLNFNYVLSCTNIHVYQVYNDTISPRFQFELYGFPKTMFLEQWRFDGTHQYIYIQDFLLDRTLSLYNNDHYYKYPVEMISPAIFNPMFRESEFVVSMVFRVDSKVEGLKQRFIPHFADYCNNSYFLYFNSIELYKYGSFVDKLKLIINNNDGLLTDKEILVKLFVGVNDTSRCNLSGYMDYINYGVVKFEMVDNLYHILNGFPEVFSSIFRSSDWFYGQTLLLVVEDLKNQNILYLFSVKNWEIQYSLFFDCGGANSEDYVQKISNAFFSTNCSNSIASDLKFTSASKWIGCENGSVKFRLNQKVFVSMVKVKGSVDGYVKEFHLKYSASGECDSWSYILNQNQRSPHMFRKSSWDVEYLSFPVPRNVLCMEVIPILYYGKRLELQLDVVQCHSGFPYMLRHRILPVSDHNFKTFAVNQYENDKIIFVASEKGTIKNGVVEHIGKTACKKEFKVRGKFVYCLDNTGNVYSQEWGTKELEQLSPLFIGLTCKSYEITFDYVFCVENDWLLYRQIRNASCNQQYAGNFIPSDSFQENNIELGALPESQCLKQCIHLQQKKYYDIDGVNLQPICSCVRSAKIVNYNANQDCCLLQPLSYFNSIVNLGDEKLERNVSLLGPEFTISMEVYVFNLKTAHFMDFAGHLAVKVDNNLLKVYYKTFHHNVPVSSQSIVQKWIHMRLVQYQQDAQYVFKVYVDGSEVLKINPDQPLIMRDVRLWSTEPLGAYRRRNLLIASGVKSLFKVVGSDCIPGEIITSRDECALAFEHLQFEQVIVDAGEFRNDGINSDLPRRCIFINNSVHWNEVPANNLTNHQAVCRKYEWRSTYAKHLSIITALSQSEVYGVLGGRPHSFNMNSQQWELLGEVVTSTNNFKLALDGSLWCIQRSNVYEWSASSKEWVLSVNDLKFYSSFDVSDDFLYCAWNREMSKVKRRKILGNFTFSIISSGFQGANGYSSGLGFQVALTSQEILFVTVQSFWLNLALTWDNIGLGNWYHLIFSCNAYKLSGDLDGVTNTDYLKTPYRTFQPIGNRDFLVGRSYGHLYVYLDDFHVSEITMWMGPFESSKFASLNTSSSERVLDYRSYKEDTFKDFSISESCDFRFNCRANEIFYYLGEECATFYEADRKCRKAGGSLAMIHSQLQFDEMMRNRDVLYASSLCNKQHMFVGYYKSKWMNGSEIDFGNVKGTQNCAKVNLTNNIAVWHTEDCHASEPYICQASHYFSQETLKAIKLTYKINDACQEKSYNEIKPIGFSAGDTVFVLVHFHELSLERSKKIESAYIAFTWSSNEVNKTVKNDITISLISEELACSMYDVFEYSVNEFIFWDLYVEQDQDGVEVVSPDISDMVKYHLRSSEVSLPVSILLVWNSVEIGQNISKFLLIINYEDNDENQFLLFNTTQLLPRYPALKFVTDAVSKSNGVISFWYLMHGNDPGTMFVWLVDGDNIKPPQLVYLLSGDQGEKWKEANILITASKRKLWFSVVRGNDQRSLIALDKIGLRETDTFSNDQKSEHNTDETKHEIYLQQLGLPLTALFYSFASSYNDFSANRKHLTVHGTIHSTWVENKFGFPYHALKVDNVFDDGSLRVNNVFEPEMSNFTILFHVKLSVSNVVLLHFGEFSNVKFHTMDGRLVISLLNEIVYSASTGIQIDIWTYVAISYERDRFSVYINNLNDEPQQRKIISNLLLPTSLHFFNSAKSSNLSSFKGSFSCFQFYKQHLLLRQIKMLEICPDRIDPLLCPYNCKNNGYCLPVKQRCECVHAENHYTIKETCENVLHSSLTFKEADLYYNFDDDDSMESKEIFKVDTLKLGPVGQASFISDRPLLLRNLPEICNEPGCLTDTVLAFWLFVDRTPNKVVKIFEYNVLSILADFLSDPASAVGVLQFNNYSKCYSQPFTMPTASWFHISIGITDTNVEFFVNKVFYKMFKHNASTCLEEEAVDYHMYAGIDEFVVRKYMLVHSANIYSLYSSIKEGMSHPDFSMKEQTDIVKENKLNTLNELGKEYVVTLELMVVSINQGGWNSIFHMTDGPDLTRVPALFFHPLSPNKLCFRIGYAGALVKSCDTHIVHKEWIFIKYRQVLQNDVYIGSFYVNDLLVCLFENNLARVLQNVHVFASIEYQLYIPTSGYIRNVVIKNYGSDHDIGRYFLDYKSFPSEWRTVIVPNIEEEYTISFSFHWKMQNNQFKRILNMFYDFNHNKLFLRLYVKKNEIHIHIIDNKDPDFMISLPFAGVNQWRSLSMFQKRIDGKYIHKVYFHNKEVFSVENHFPHVFNNVFLGIDFASNWEIRNLHVIGNSAIFPTKDVKSMKGPELKMEIYIRSSDYYVDNRLIGDVYRIVWNNFHNVIGHCLESVKDDISIGIDELRLVNETDVECRCTIQFSKLRNKDIMFKINSVPESGVNYKERIYTFHSSISAQIPYHLANFSISLNQSTMKVKIWNLDDLRANVNFKGVTVDLYIYIYNTTTLYSTSSMLHYPSGDEIVFTEIIPMKDYLIFLFPTYHTGFGLLSHRTITTKWAVNRFPPENLNCSVLNSSSVNVTWDEYNTTHYNSPNLLAYTVCFVNITNRTEFGVFENTNIDAKNRTCVNTSATSIVLDGLEAYTFIKIEVATFNDIGLGTFASITELTAPDYPGPPYSANISVNETFLFVSWMRTPLRDVNSYIIESYNVTIVAHHPLYDALEDSCKGAVFIVDRNVTSKEQMSVCPPNQIVKVMVFARNDVGLSEPLENCIALPPAAPVSRVNHFEGYNLNYAGSIELFATLNLSIGGMEIKDEQSIITYYKVNYTALDWPELGSNVVNISVTEENDELISLWDGFYTGTENCSAAANITSSAKIVNYTLNHLVYNTSYLLHVYACSDIDCSNAFIEKTIVTSAHEPTCSPSNITLTNTSSTSLNVSFGKLPKKCLHGSLLYYGIILLEASVHKTFDNVTLDETNVKTTTDGYLAFDGLHEYWNYSVVVFATTIMGHGIFSTPVFGYTNQDVPYSPPSLFAVVDFDVNKRELMLQWNEVNLMDQNGIIVEYRVFGNALLQNLTIHYVNAIIDGSFFRSTLKVFPFTIYNLSLTACTVIGCGPSTNLTHKVNETVPDCGPSNVSINYITSNFSSIQWNDIGVMEENGILTNFRVIVTGMLRNGTNHIIDELVDINIHNFTCAVFPGVHYFHRVSVCTRIGCGPFSAIDRWTKEIAPSGPVNNFDCIVKSSSAISCYWDEVESMLRNGDIHYIINYTNHLQPWESIGDTFTGFNFTSQLFSNIELLGNRTTYEIVIQPYTSGGHGPSSSLNRTTEEDVPSAPPKNISTEALTSSSISVQWDELLPEYSQGLVTSYNVCYSVPESFTNVRGGILSGCVQHFFTSCVLGNLSLGTPYMIKIAANTAKGTGVFSEAQEQYSGSYVDGNWTQWTNWGECSQSCALGEISRYRTCANPPPLNNGRDCDGPTMKSLPCNDFPCPTYYLSRAGESCTAFCESLDPTIKCSAIINTENSSEIFNHLHDGYDYREIIASSCSVTENSKAYSMFYNPSFDLETNVCEGYSNVPTITKCSFQAPQNIRRLCHCLDAASSYFTSWAPWSLLCTESCGLGKQVRYRECILDEGCGDRIYVEGRDCNTHPCPINGRWSEWSPLSSCSQSCGHGYMQRTRECSNPYPWHGGLTCDGISIEVIPDCQLNPCAVHGGWGEWGKIGECSAACGNNGHRKRTRYCNSPSPDHGGSDCIGIKHEYFGCEYNRTCPPVKVDFVVRFVKEQWHYSMYRIDNKRNVNLFNHIIDQILGAYRNSSIAHISEDLTFFVFQMWSGSVVVHFAITYPSVPSVEMLYLQNLLDYTGFLGDMQVKLLSITTENVPTDFPPNITAQSNSPSTINVAWNEIVNITAYNGQFYLYYVYYKSEDYPWNHVGTRGTHQQIVDLSPGMLYSLRVLISNENGNGVASPPLFVRTMESVPLIKPPNCHYQVMDYETVYFSWDFIPAEFVPGVLLGYKISIENVHKSWNKHTKIAFTNMFGIVVDVLEGAQLYRVEIAGFTIAGSGPHELFFVRTPPGRPGVAPPNMTAVNHTSWKEALVTWDFLPTEQENGRVIGYEVSYILVRQSNMGVIGELPIVRIVDRYTRRYRLNNLESYSTYMITVSAFSAIGNGPSAVTFVETCACPEYIFGNWYLLKPMVYVNRQDAIVGTLPSIILDVFETVCTTCLAYQHRSRVHLEYTNDGHFARKVNERDLKGYVSDRTHLSFPINQKFTYTRFMGEYPFVGIIPSQGSALLVYKPKVRIVGFSEVFAAVCSSWPVVLVAVLLCQCVGLVLWFGEQNSPVADLTVKKIFRGSLEGFWLAFISMTTVGYGDYTVYSPRSRVIMFFWTLTGLVIVCLFGSAVSSRLSVKQLTSDYSLYGRNMAVLEYSNEEKTAISRNAILNRNYSTVDEVFAAVSKQEVEMGLVDVFELMGREKEMVSMNIQVGRILQLHYGYGIVLSAELKRLENDFRTYVTMNQAKIVQNMIDQYGIITITSFQQSEQILSEEETVAMFMYFGIAFIALSLVGILKWCISTKMKNNNKLHPKETNGKRYYNSLVTLQQDMRSLLDISRLVNRTYEEQLNERVELSDLKRNLKRHQLSDLKWNLKRHRYSPDT